MKKIFILIFVCFSTFVFASGDDDYSYKRRRTAQFSVNEYEPYLNLQYISVNDTAEYKPDEEKDKIKKIVITTDVAVYSIKKDSITYIFNQQNKENIIKFEYEVEYNSTDKMMIFNTDYTKEVEYYSYDFSSNNCNILQRTASNSIIIVTQNVQTLQYTIWKCDKYGKNLQKISTLNSNQSWEIDVKNQMIRIITSIPNAISITNYMY